MAVCEVSASVSASGNLRPAINGVPTAPKAAKIPSKSNTAATDKRGLKPIEMSSNGTIAPGVPKPATPSKKPVSPIAMIKNWVCFEG